MKAIDTNVLIRYLTRDDPDQVERAEAALSVECLVTNTVLIETVWVLASVFRIKREAIASALSQLLRLSTLRMEDGALIAWAVERFRDGADFADMVHIASSTAADAFVTFDMDIAKRAGPDCPLPIETLG